MNPIHNNSAVLVLAWPEVTARSEDKIMKILRKIGIVKNLNILVGHAAMIVVDGSDMRYYDFGRYITPHHMGRVRSAKTDPTLTLSTKVQWTDNGNIDNIEEICRELESKSRYTHGEGKLWMTVYTTPLIEKVEAKALEMQNKGLIGYKTFDKNQTNCARFVQTSLLAGLKHQKNHFRRFYWPITYNAPTPYFNILAATIDKKYYIEWQKGVLNIRQSSLLHSYWDITNKVFSSMSRGRTKNISDDTIVGQLKEPAIRPENIHDDAVYLGGIGEGGWYYYCTVNDNILKGIRWSKDGQLDFETQYRIEETDIYPLSEEKLKIVHDSHKAWLTFEVKNGKKIRAYELDT